MDTDGVDTIESISTSLPNTQPSSNSQDPDPCYNTSFDPCTSSRLTEDASSLEPIPANLKTQTVNHVHDPDPLVLIHTPKGLVHPQFPCHKATHSVGLGVVVDVMEPVLYHPNTQADTIDPDPHVLIQSPQDIVFPLVEEVQRINQKGDSMEDNVIDHLFNTHVLTNQGQNLVTGPLQHQCQICEKEGLETKLKSDPHGATPPVDAYWALCKSCTNREQGIEGVSLKPPEEQNDSTKELWLDTCQYHTLAGEEEEEGAISVSDQESCYPVGRRSVTECLDNTKGSGFLQGTEVAIGQGGSDSDQWLSIAPVERSMSTDSWYSALSDWTVKFTEEDLQPEDFTGTAALTKAQEKGQEQVYPQMRMAIQDQAVEPKSSPKTLNVPGPVELLLLGNLQDRKGQEEGTETEFLVGCISAAEQWDPEPGRESVITGDGCPAKPRDNHSTLGSSSDTLASPTTKVLGLEMKMTEVAPAHLSLSFSSALSGDLATETAPLGKDLFEDIDISHRKGSYLQEDSVDRLQSQNPIAEPQMSKHVKDALRKVTEDSIWQPCGLFMEEKDEEKTYRTVNISGYPSGSKDPEVDCMFGGKKRLQQKKEFQLVTHSNRYTQVLGNRDTLSQNTNEDAHVLPNPQDFHGRSSQGGNPQFLMPVMALDPLSHSLGQSLSCHTNSALEGVNIQTCTKNSLFKNNKGLSCVFLQPKIPPLPVLPTCFRRINDNRTSTENKEENVFTIMKSNISCDNKTAEEQIRKLTSSSVRNVNQDFPTSSSPSEASAEHWSLDRKKNSTVPQEVSLLSKELSNCIIVTSDHVMISEKERIAYVTLDQKVPLDARTSLLKQIESDKNKQPNNSITADLKRGSKMPNKTRTHSKKGKSLLGSKPQENILLDPVPTIEDGDNGTVAVMETVTSTKAHGKKKHPGKHPQNTTAKGEGVGVQPLVGVENGAKPKAATKGKIDIFEAKFGPKAWKIKDKSTAAISCKQDNVHLDSKQEQLPMKEVATSVDSATPHDVVSKGLLSTTPFGQKLNDDVIKRRRLSFDKLRKQEADVDTTRRKAYSEVLKQRTQQAPKEVPRVVQPIQAVSVIDDPQSLDLWCQFTAVFTDYTVTWTREGDVLAETKRSAGDERGVSLTITKASNKDLGKYSCRLICSHGSVVLDYLLTYEVLSEIVIPATPQKSTTATTTEMLGEEEAVNCCCLLFKEDFLSDQYFGENQSASLVTEKEHFGEGMHRKAFRTRLQAGMVTVFTQNHPCVLKVHNAISYGTKNNEELVQKNYNLAVEECHVQNTAREYIKAWTAVTQTQDTFGEVPEIIPIYLVHRPSNDIPYATLEEELMGEFVKYSVRDGKEINLKRRDSEAGQKCCAFQHWVYQNTEGNLLVTDMQGVGMRLTDVGIATCKKGYKGFKGNCATSFIDQFKALHLCNKYCEILGLKSLQPKPKKAVGPKPKPTQSAMKKKASGPTLKSKS
ncbi:alpha-protein kinase 2 [Esox lucius]|uniref:non-specific serine/threonine protein kinase n=1 Tax=Esox lucius TaxID=8010 RepID=A0A3P8XZ56_ESOLU|nr:alpha-protein kinase 2 [Esox lucius]XP_012992448.2 alpha-protein kinase 2 [Esox lucius]